MIEGFALLADYLSSAAQARLLAEVTARLVDAPLFQPTMPRSGRPMSVRMSNFGSLGWVADVQGYRYQEAHPATGRPWPAMPSMLLELWDAVAGYGAPPEACLVNVYGATSRMGLHVDADETARDAPVVSVSLGARALFRLGGLQRSDPTTSFRLTSGDVVVLAGCSRRAFHGVDRIYPGTSRLAPDGGRVNLTLRRVTQPAFEDGAAVGSAS